MTHVILVSPVLFAIYFDCHVGIHYASLLQLKCIFVRFLGALSSFFSMKSCYNRWTCRSHYLLNIFWHYAPFEFQTKPSFVCQACRSCLTSGHSFADALSPICFNVWCILFVRLVCCVRFAQYRAGRVRVSDYTVIWRR